MKQFYNKTFFVFFTLLLFLNLTACAVTGEKAKSDEKLTISRSEIIGETEEVFIRDEVYPFKGGCTVSAVVRIGDTLLIQGYDKENPIFTLAKVSLDEFDRVHIDGYSPIVLDDYGNVNRSMVCGITAGKDNKFYILTSERPKEYTHNGEKRSNPDYQGRIAILQYSPYGELLGKCEFDKWIEEDIYGILVADNQHVIIYGQSYIAGFSLEKPDEIAVQRIDESCCIMTGALWKDSIIFSVWGASDSYFKYDVESGNLSPVEIHDGSGLREESIDGFSKCQGLDGELILNEALQFWVCEDLDNCQSKFRWNYTVNSEFLPYVCRVSENFFVCSASGKESLSIIGMVKQPKTVQSIVNVALVNMNGNSILAALTEQNLRRGEYRYEITEYDESNVERLLVDMNSGKSPDLIVFDRDFQTGANMFENLYSFIDNDKDISRDSFIPNYLESLSVNGELFEIWPSVAINTIAVRSSDLGGKKALTIADCKDIVNESDKYNSIFGNFMTKENLLRWVSIIGTSVYVDKEKGTCSFNNEDFSKLLSLCSEMGADGSLSESLPDVSENLLVVYIISSANAISSIHNVLGEEYAFMGFPTANGGCSFYSCGLSGKMSIPKMSNNKEGAWKFIKTMLQQENQNKITYYLPVNMAAFQRQAEASLNDNEIELLMKLVSETRYAENTADNLLREIILSSGKAFLAGEKTIEETMDIIQSKANIYMAEKYG